MRYTYHLRGRCKSCGDILWVMLAEGNVFCPCYKGAIKNKQLINLEPITDEEHLIAIHKDFYWLGDITADTTITLIEAT